MTFRQNEPSRTQSGTCFDRNLVKQRPVDRGPVDRSPVDRKNKIAHRFLKKLWKSAFVPNGVYSVFTEPFEIGVNRKVLFFYDHNSEGSFIGARVVEKLTEKGVEKSRLQGFPVGPMENPIDYHLNGRISTHHEMSLK